MSRLFHTQTRRRMLMVAGAILAQVNASAAQRRGNNGDECTTPQPNPPPDFFCGICFLAGTMIRTPNGDQRVEDVRPGDIVLTSRGSAPIRFVGHFQRRCSRMWRPIRIRAGALDDGIPANDLVVTPDHALFVSGVLVPAGDIVNGVSVVEERLSSGLHTFFHVELERHDVILAQGAWAETMRPVRGHAGFDNDDGEREDAVDAARLELFAPLVGVRGGRQAARALWQSLRGQEFDARLAAIQESIWRRSRAADAA